MDDHWWDRWVVYHLTLFGRQTQAEALATMSLWRKVFVPAGYSEEEMKAASHEVALNGKKIAFLNEHLEEVRRALHSIRSQGREPEPKRNEEGPPCVDCFNSGTVSVPHIRSMVDGRWVKIVGNMFYEMVVRCRCLAGQRAYRRGCRIMTLDDYEEECPHWRTEWSQRWREEKQARLTSSEMESMPRVPIDEALRKALKSNRTTETPS